MSLRTLVDHIQSHFGDFRGLPSVTPPNTRLGSQLLSGSDATPQVDRPELPPWLHPTERESLEEVDESGPWVIEAEVPPPDPPPGINQSGVDVLAFYLPFHFYRTEWGIYVRASGIVYLACVIKGSARLRLNRFSHRLLGYPYAPLNPGDEKFLYLADKVLREHEAFHFASEVAASRSEVIAKVPIYRPYFSSRAATALEEALANAQAITHGLRKQRSLTRKRLHDWMKGQGTGYRDFHRWISGRAFSEGLSRASEFMLESVPPHRTTAGLGEFLFRSSRAVAAPTYLLADLTHGAVGILRPFPKAFGLRVLVHSNDHRPPHIHIESPIGNRETRRYNWPALSAFKGERLPAPAERRLRTYVDLYHKRIQERIRAVYGEA